MRPPPRKPLPTYQASHPARVKRLPALMSKHISLALKDHVLPFDWDVRKVWRLASPVTKVASTEFAYLLELPLWSSVPNKGLLFDISPLEVIRNPDASPYQTRRLVEADLRFAIDILWLNNRRWVLDGVHRIAKHFTLNTPELQVRFHDASIIADLSVS